MPNDIPPGRLLVWIQAKLLENGGKNRHMILGLAQVLLPFFDQVVVNRTAERGLINQHSALFCLKRFI